MKRIAIYILTCLLTLISSQVINAQNVAIKTNALYWATTTPNIGLEFGVAPKWTLEVSGAYNPWTFKDNKKMKCWLVQPEAKYWLCERFEGHFFGLHAHAAQYYGGFRQNRYDGYLAGAGISYGYDWILSPHWNLEAEIGVGYAYMWYYKSPRVDCVKCRTKEHYNYVGPTKVALTVSYIFY